MSAAQDALIAPVINALGVGLHALWPLEPAARWLLAAGLLLAVWRGVRGAFAAETCAEPTQPARRGWTWAVCGLTLLGLCLRLYGRDVLPYWWDELLAVWLAQADVPLMVRSLFSPAAPASDFTPPLFYLLLHGWFGLFGDSEASARLLTGMLSTAAIPLVCVLGARLHSRRAGLLAGLLLCLSPPAVFYAQQVRCYALLGSLALVCVLLAERLARRGSARDALALGAAGTLFLYTHFVASWLWLGLGAAVVCPALARLVGLRAPAWLKRLAAVAGGFALVALAPFFQGGINESAAGFAPMLLVVAAALLAAPGAPADTPKPTMAQALRAVLAFFVPAALLCAWVLPSGVVRVIGGAGSRVPGSYGFPEFSRLLADFAGPQAALQPGVTGLGLYAALCGLFLLGGRMPRAARLLCGWVALPLALAMLAQNQSMNLGRYLLATLPGVLLLAAVACCAAWDALAALAPPVRHAFLRPVAATTGTLLLALAVFGYAAYTALPLPTVRANIEQYRAVAAALASQPRFLLRAESPNLVRALSWYMVRLGRSEVRFGPEDRRFSAVNAFLDGRFWHPGAAAALGVEQGGRVPGPFGEIALYDVPRAAAPVAGSGGQRDLRVGVADFPGRTLSGQDAAVADGQGGGVMCLFKGRPCQADVELGPAPGTGLLLSARATVAGVGSVARVELLADGAPVGGLELRGGKETYSEARTVSTPVQLPADAAGKTLLARVTLADDGSGVIYSSNAVLHALELKLLP